MRKLGVLRSAAIQMLVPATTAFAQASGQEAAAPAQVPSLTDLHDIVLPEPVPWMPSTAAWYVLFAVVAALAALGLWTVVRRYRANRYRREALREVDVIEAALRSGAAEATTLAALPRLTKRVALCVSPRAEAAVLSGDAWLGFLDESYGGTGFTQGAGRLLPTLSYGTPSAVDDISSEQLTELTALLRQWIRTHHVRV